MNTKYYLIIFFLFYVFKLNAQENSTTTNLNYLEDQIYVSLTYNILNNKPAFISQKGFSGGLSIGFIKDIPINKQRNIGFGIGLGYAYNAYIQNLKITRNNQTTLFEIAQNYKINRFTTNAIELPIEFRWRNSTPEKYRFWRVYGGIKFAYLFSANTKYVNLNETITTKNIPEFNKFQYGLIIAAGYSTWNLYVYYGLKPTFKNVQFNSEELNFTDFNIGLKFYIM